MQTLPSLVALCGLPFLVNGQAAPPGGLGAEGYDHHVELGWDRPQDPAVTGLRVFGARGEDTEFANLGAASLVDNGYIDFVGDFDVTTRYFLRSVGSDGQLGPPSDTVEATTVEFTDSALLDMVQQYTLRYFYDFGHPVSGMARERNTTATVTTGGSGFGLMALIVGAERGFITRQQALERTTKIVDWLGTVPRFRGAFAHWMNGATGAVIPFSELDNGGDLVETSFLIQGLLTSRQYFDGSSEAESQLRDDINSIYAGVDWDYYRQEENVLYWHWSPDFDFDIGLQLRGFNEVHITYILGIASPEPSHRIPASLYHDGWVANGYRTSNTFYDVPLLVGRGKGGPLFFAHYSYLGFDPRGKRDRYVNYFERNTNHTLINHLHCVDNPYDREGYSAENWGLTASDDPDGYLAHAPDNATVDNGTIAPTAALGSMPYTPELSMAALKHFYRELGDRNWGRYGFYDAFNQSRDWYADSYLAIDQGPIVIMIENYRSGLLWDLFMSSPEIEPALAEIGFEQDSTVGVAAFTNFNTPPRLYPNPASEQSELLLDLDKQTHIRVDLIDQSGRFVTTLLEGTKLPPGSSRLPLHLRPRPNGLYFIRLTDDAGATHAIPLIIAR